MCKIRRMRASKVFLTKDKKNLIAFCRRDSSADKGTISGQASLFEEQGFLFPE